MCVRACALDVGVEPAGGSHVWVCLGGLLWAGRVVNLRCALRVRVCAVSRASATSLFVLRVFRCVCAVCACVLHVPCVCALLRCECERCGGLRCAVRAALCCVYFVRCATCDVLWYVCCVVLRCAVFTCTCDVLSDM